MPPLAAAAGMAMPATAPRSARPAAPSPGRRWVPARPALRKLAGRAKVAYVHREANARVSRALETLTDDERRTVLDGMQLYAAGSGDSALAVFARDAATGALTFVEEDKQGTAGIEGLGGVSALAVSPDGLNVYAAGTQDDSVAVFARDAATGALSFVERERDSVDGVGGLAGVNAVAVSPDGLNVYASGGTANALVVFLRDATTGTLTFIGTQAGPKGPQAIAISADGSNVYVADGSDSAVVVFSRDAGSGMLTLVQTVKDNTDGVDGLLGAASLAVSPDDAHVYVAGKLDDAVAVFGRDPSTGMLSFIELERQAVDGVDGLDGVQALAVSADGTHVYTAASNRSAVGVSWT